MSDFSREALGLKVPLRVKNLFELQGLNSHAIIGCLKTNDIGDLENFAQKQFNAKMVDVINQKQVDRKDYLGIYACCQKLFKLSVGDIITINVLIDVCSSRQQPAIQPAPAMLGYQVQEYSRFTCVKSDKSL